MRTVSSEALRTSIMSQLSTEFPMTDLGTLSSFLGISVTRDAGGLSYPGNIMLLTFWPVQICLLVNHQPIWLILMLSLVPLLAPQWMIPPSTVVLQGIFST